MPLGPGAKLGPYEVLAPLGAGGMGEVYRARDTRLGRDVAIKVLPAEVAQDAERRSRFEREARAVSGLNHPHICTLHDIGQQDGLDYLVMELLEGQTLFERLEKGALPTDQVLRFGIEIADALSQAHKHGVVHRDLKPGNIMLIKSGVKLLDFGLAKTHAKGALGMGSELATGTRPLTRAGTLLGTYQYMAPEQLEGKEADARTDIWALGCVLFEMATGQRAFSGKSHASLIAAILEHDPPPIAQLQPMTPPALDRLVRKCLAKDPDERWDTVHDLCDELKWVSETATSPGSAKTAPRRHEWVAWALAGGLGLALLGLAAAVVRRPQREARVVRFDVPPPEGTELQPYLAMSPDGSHLAFTAKGEDGLDRLYLRSLDSGKSEPIAGTDGAQQPFWSPDGRSLGFFAQSKLKRVEIGAGAPQAICSVPGLRGATWSRDGVILFGIGGAYGLSRVAATGGTPEPVTTLDASRSETSHRWPFFLPDGRHFLYLVFGGASASISVGSLDGQKPQRLIDAFSAPTYAAGHVLFVHDGALRGQAFDAAALRLIGDPVTLADPVQVDNNMWGGTPVSAGGDVLAHRSGRISTVQLTWLDRDGRELGSVGPSGDFGAFALSPDGGRIVIQVWDAMQHLALVDFGTGAFRRFTFKPELLGWPCWSPDGRSIAYGSNRNGAFDIFLTPATGAGTDETLVHGGGSNWCDGFSPDGRLLLYQSSDPKTENDLWVVPLSGDRKPRPFLRTEASETHASFSPNGRWVAYTSDASGRAEVYVRAFPSGEGPWQISTDGGDQAQWRRDESELFYLSPARRMMAVAVNGDGPAFKASPPKALFRARMRAPGIVAQRNEYAVLADGRRFLINKLVEDPAKGTITVVVNWASKLPR